MTFVIPLAFGLFATAKPALTIFVGQAYIGGTLPLMVLCLAYGATVFASGVSPMLLAISETRISMAITTMSSLVGLASAFLFLPVLGIVGASVGRGFAILVSTFVVILFLDRKKAMQLDVGAIWKSLVAASAMALVLLSAQLVFYSRLLLPAYVILGGIVYLIVLRLLRTVRRDDVDLIAGYLGPRLSFVTKLLDIIVTSD